MVTLSVLDLATVGRGATAADALADTVRLASEVERLGYRRLWVAEHHGMPMVASSAPAVLVGHLADVTTTLRVGAGGVMLPNHAPLVIAEQFGTLEALHPGRIDLGLGRAPGTDQVTARALRRNTEVGPDAFPEDVVELISYLLDSDAPATHPAAVPGRGYLPEMWLLGSSTFSARLAGMLGLRFSFAYHFAPDLVDQALEQYRANFRPSVLLKAPHAMVAVSVVCAADEDQARWLAGPSGLTMLQLRSGRLGPVATPEEAAAYRYTDQERVLIESATSSHLVGDPDQVHRGLLDLVERTAAEEIMVSTRVHSYQARLQSLALVAERWPVEQATDSTPAA
jgi:luciferase family oxidoreductase group 1